MYARGRKKTEKCGMISQKKVHKVLMQLAKYQIVFWLSNMPMQKNHMMGLQNVIKTPSFKFGQIQAASKDFHEKRQVTDIVVVSDKVPHNSDCVMQL